MESVQAIARIKELEQENENLKKEVQLTKLRRKVTPHFLFNSLSVAMGLVMQDRKTAVAFLRDLAKMYRYLLSYGNEYAVPIEQEVEMMEQYYGLMRLRHVDSIRLNITPEVRKAKGYGIPPLSLQGLLENAIRHNAHSKKQPLDVTLDVRDGYLIMQNNIMPLVAVGESTKMGLAYITESVRLLYNQEIKIENDGNTFTVMIPLVKE
jgi:LytS/YehU family sensor histidine kinase